MRGLKIFTAAAAMAMLAASAQAALFVWNGASAGNWASGGNWDRGSVPNTGGGDSIQVSSGSIVYTAGGDWTLNGGTATFDGGSFVQTGGIAWLQIARGGLGGELLVKSGSTFDVGTSGNMLVGGTGGGKVTVDGGTLIAKGMNYYNSSMLTIRNGGSLSQSGSNLALGSGVTFSLSGNGSSFTTTGEFKPGSGSSVSISGGTLNATLISFDGGDATISFSGGRINLTNGTAWQGGVYGGGAARYINYTGGAAGVIHLRGDTTGSYANNLLNIGTVKLNGVQGAAPFAVTTDATGSYIALVPEPTMLAGVGAASLLALRRRPA